MFAYRVSQRSSVGCVCKEKHQINNFTTIYIRVGALFLVIKRTHLKLTIVSVRMNFDRGILQSAFNN